MTPFALVVTFRLRPGALSAFLPMVLENARTSVAEEPGCRRFDVCLPETGSHEAGDEVLLYEVYDDAAAFGAHLATPHFLSFDAATRDMVAAKEARRFVVHVHG